MGAFWDRIVEEILGVLSAGLLVLAGMLWARKVEKTEFSELKGRFEAFMIDFDNRSETAKRVFEALGDQIRKVDSDAKLAVDKLNGEMREEFNRAEKLEQERFANQNVLLTEMHNDLKLLLRRGTDPRGL